MNFLLPLLIHQILGVEGCGELGGAMTQSLPPLAGDPGVTDLHQSHPQSEEFFHGVVVPNSLNESQKTEIKDEPSENELNNDSEEHLDDYMENVDEALENQENNVNSEDLRCVEFN